MDKRANNKENTDFKPAKRKPQIYDGMKVKNSMNKDFKLGERKSKYKIA